jgi:hypothetical protein
VLESPYTVQSQVLSDPECDNPYLKRFYYTHISSLRMSKKTERCRRLIAMRFYQYFFIVIHAECHP